MKKLTTIILLLIGVCAFGQFDIVKRTLTVDTVKGRVDSLYLKGNISVNGTPIEDLSGGSIDTTSLSNRIDTKATSTAGLNQVAIGDGNGNLVGYPDLIIENTYNYGLSQRFYTGTTYGNGLYVRKTFGSGGSYYPWLVFGNYGNDSLTINQSSLNFKHNNGTETNYSISGFTTFKSGFFRIQLEDSSLTLSNNGIIRTQLNPAATGTNYAYTLNTTETIDSILKVLADDILRMRVTSSGGDLFGTWNYNGVEIGTGSGGAMTAQEINDSVKLEITRTLNDTIKFDYTTNTYRAYEMSGALTIVSDTTNSKDECTSSFSLRSDGSALTLPTNWISKNSKYDYIAVDGVEHEFIIYKRFNKIWYNIHDTSYIDETAPLLVSSQIGNGGNDSVIYVTFNEAVTITDTSGIRPTIQDVQKEVEAITGSGTTVLGFEIKGDTVISTDTVIIDITADNNIIDGSGNAFVADFDTVTNNVAPIGYTFSDTYSLVVDAQSEGVTVAEDSLYPVSAGNDRAFSIELWYKTPSAFDVTKNLIVYDNGSFNILAYINTSGVLIFRLRTDASNTIEASTGAFSLSTSTTHHIILTYDATETYAGINMYVDNVSRKSSDLSIGTYTGLSVLGMFKLDIPFSGGATYGEGEYRNYRMFNIELSGAQVTTLYNSGTPLSLSSQTAIINATMIELQFEQNTDAEIGTNGSEVGTPTYTTN